MSFWDAISGVASKASQIIASFGEELSDDVVLNVNQGNGNGEGQQGPDDGLAYDSESEEEQLQQVGWSFSWLLSRFF